MKKLFLGVLMMLFLTVPQTVYGELIWGEVESIYDQGNTMIIRSYNSWTGDMESVRVQIPPTVDWERIASIHHLKAGDEILVEAHPATDEESYVADFVNLPASYKE